MEARLMLPILFYLVTLAVLFFIFIILGIGLNIQFGYAGILDFAYITFMAVGAYIGGVLALGPKTANLNQDYILGLALPFPLPLIAGALAGGVMGFFVGLIALHRLRSDFLAIVTVSIASIAWDIVGNYNHLFNGWDGIAGVPEPLNDVLNLDPNTYIIVFAFWAGLLAIVLWLAANRIYASPLGRTFRAIREDLDVAEAFGKNTFRFRMLAMVIGCVYAGIAGVLTIEFIGGMNPQGWTVLETFVVWTAILVGGRANNLGVVLGTLLVPVIFVEGTRFLPIALLGNTGLLEASRNVAIGLLLIGVLWFRPQGLIPERKSLIQ
jgi:branched-chain amino acid transport system permease protein